MSNAHIFPGQGAQFSGMGKDIYESNSRARAMMDRANKILGFNITDIMFEGSDEDLKATRVTQPAIFLHSVVLAECTDLAKPAMVGGHSLGEFSALVAAGAVSFEDGLNLVSIRAEQMQVCCEKTPGAMAAIIGLPAEDVERVCKTIKGLVIPANYNNYSQIVISGETDAVNECCEALKAAGARRALLLNVGGAFHSPLMEPARAGLAAAIRDVEIRAPRCPIFQNVTARPETDPSRIKENLLLQLTSPVRWTQSVVGMLEAGADSFLEIGPGKALQGMVSKIAAFRNYEDITIEGIQ